MAHGSRQSINEFLRTHLYSPFTQSLRRKLLLFFLVLAFVPALVTGFLSFRISSGIVFKMAEESSIELIDRISEEMDSLLSDTIYFMYHVQEIPVLMQGLRESFETIERRYLTDFNVSSELQFISDYKKEIFGIYILGENKSKFKSNYYTFREDDLRSTVWYKKVFASDVLESFGPYKDSHTVKTAENWGMEFFSLGIPYVDRFTGNRVGIILAEIEKQTITEILDSTLGKTGFILLLDNDNNILLAPDNFNEKIDLGGFPRAVPENFKELIINQRFLGIESSPGAEIVTSDDYIFIYRSLGITNWKVVGVIPYRELRVDKNNSIWFIILTAFLSCILAGVASFKLSSRIVSPVTELTALMQKVEEGNLTVRMPELGHDEIGKLSSGFNVMAGKLKNSMDQIYHDQSTIRKTELQLLQAQINPHFLYNTLDAIKYLIKREQNRDAVKMVVSLARFFRSSLSKGRAVIPLSEELDRIENYLTILRLRYKNKFSYEIDVPAHLLESRILKLSLQPIVENAIYHGIKEQPEDGILRISARGYDDKVVIEVEDSGKGMSDEKIGELNSRIHERSRGNERSYGLHNVQERIEIFFGREYGLLFRQRAGGGTIVSMTLPSETEEKY